MVFSETTPCLEYPIVAFDTETSGAYPLESEVIEIGAVKWHNGQIIDRFQTLVRPSELLTPENTRIHGITNDMVANAPLMKEVILGFCEFVNDSVLLAHHAPFDLGFMAPAIEKNGLNFPKNKHFCTSLLSRSLLHTTNHKLQTLVKELQLIGGDAHRAYDDAYACLQVFLKCIDKLSPEVTVQRLQEIQIKDIKWDNYRVLNTDDEKIKTIVQSITESKPLQIKYEGGQSKKEFRTIKPKGLIRNPDGDYVNAVCDIDQQRKRFYLSKISF